MLLRFSDIPYNSLELPMKFRLLTLSTAAVLALGSFSAATPAEAAVYTPSNQSSICGAGSWSVAASQIVYNKAHTHRANFVLWHSGRNWCAATFNLNRGVSTLGAYIWDGAGTERVDRGNYSFYAGPVKLTLPSTIDHPVAAGTVA